jgi:hypothetical protein
MSINITTTVTIWEPTKSTRLERAVDRIYHHGLHSDDGSSGSGRRHEMKKDKFRKWKQKELRGNHSHVLGQNQQTSPRLTECKKCTGQVINTKNHKQYIIN